MPPPHPIALLLTRYAREVGRLAIKVRLAERLRHDRKEIKERRQKLDAKLDEAIDHYLNDIE